MLAHATPVVQLIQSLLYSSNDTSRTASANADSTAYTLPLYGLYSPSCAGMCRMLLQQLMTCLLCSLLVAPYPVKRAKSLRGILHYSMLSKFLQLAVMH